MKSCFKSVRLYTLRRISCKRPSFGKSHPRRPRDSQSGAGEMARRKFSRTGGRTPGYQVSPDHFQTALRIPAPDWAEKIPCIILPNQEPVFAKPFGNGPVRLGTQGFFRPFLKTLVAPFCPPPTDCPWVSEDGKVPSNIVSDRKRSSSL